MRASLERGAVAEPVRIARRAGAPELVGSVATLLLAFAVLRGGGGGDSGVAWVGGAAVTAVAVSIVLLGVVPLDRAGLAFAGLLAGFVAWSGLTVVSSIQPDRSWSFFNRGVAYVALLALGALVGALVPRAPRVAGVVLAATFGVAIAWALAGKVVPALGPDVTRSARLREPVGYWNALALVVAMSVPLWLWLAGGGRARAVRAAAAVALFTSVVALLLTASRGGLVVTLVAAAAWLALGRDRLEGVGALAVAVPPGLAVGVWALTRADLSEAGVRERADEGALLGVLLLAGGALVFVAAWAAARVRLSDPARRRAGAAIAVAAVALAAGGAGVAVGAADDPAGWVDARVDEFRNPPGEQVEQGATRLTGFSSNNRWTWWTDAWRIFRANPWDGTGAGTFELARRPQREDTQAPASPHQLALQALSETGVVGFALLAAAAVAGVGAVALALRRLRGADRAAGGALAALAVAYVAHSLIDMGWDYVAVSAPFFLALGVLVAGRGGRIAGRRLVRALATAAVAVALVASLAPPRLAADRVDAAFAALGDGDLDGAESAASRARLLNPLAVTPIHVEATVAEVRGDLGEAERLYARAVELQPRNPETWYELGRFVFEARRDPDRALVILDRGYALDPFHTEIPRALNDVRAALEARG